MNTISTDYAHSCRLCLTNLGIRVPIFEDELNSIVDTMLPSKILTCVSIKIKREDPYPRWICQHCQAKIDDIYEFRRMCNLSDAKLKKNFGIFTSQREHVTQHETLKETTSSRYQGEDQVSCATSDNIKVKIKQESVDYTTASIGTVNQVFVKIEDNHGFESEGMEPSSEFEAKVEVPEANTRKYVSSSTVESPEHGLQDNEYEFPALIKPELLQCQGLEIQPIYEEVDNNIPPHFLVLGDNRRLRPRNPRNLSGLSLECPICCCPFTYQAAYDKHRKICKKKISHKKRRQVSDLECRICEVKFETQVALINHGKHHRKHSKTHLKPKKVTFDCHTCNIMFQQKGELICHQAQYHQAQVNKNVAQPKEATFDCHTCNIVFQQKGELICHQAQYHRAQVNKNVAQQKVFSCDKCGLSFVHKGEYILHKEFHHTASRLTCRLPIYRAVAQVTASSTDRLLCGGSPFHLRNT